MGNISRANFAAEFKDTVSMQLLQEPQPQFFYAAMLKQALSAELDVNAPGIPGRGVEGTGPSYITLPEMQLQVADPYYKDAVTVVLELGKEHQGHTVQINRPQFTDSTYTHASRKIPVGTTIGTTPVNVDATQVKVTIERIGGPYDNTLAAVEPYGIENFDINRGVHNLKEVRNLFFKRDFEKTIDKIMVDLYDLAGTAIYPKGMTAVNDSTQVGDRPFSFNQILSTRTSLSTANIPTFANGRYMMVLTSLQLEQLDKDPMYQRLVRTFDTEMNPVLRKQYRGSVSKFDIFESTTLSLTANSNSVPIQYGHAFGPGMVGVGAGGMPRCFTSTNDNYEQTLLAIWLWFCGFSVLDSRFGRSVRSS
jgi:hypothetical protein